MADMNDIQQNPETNEKAEGKRKKVKEKKPLGQEIVEWVLTILCALLIAFAVRSFIFEPIRVDGESMMDTLQNGEIMVVTKFDYGTLYMQWPWAADKDPHIRGNEGATGDCTCARYPLFGNPKRFDVVVCRYPGRGDTNFVKRVIGLPGDTLKLEDGYIYIMAAGETEFTRYDEPYITDSYRSGYLNTSLISAIFYSGQVKYQLNADGSYTVPEGKYFVIGDHRNNSNDSRMQGPVDRDMIVGKVSTVVWPLNKIRAVPNGLNVK